MCTPLSLREYDYAKKKIAGSDYHRWLRRCVERFDSTEPLYTDIIPRPFFFPLSRQHIPLNYENICGNHRFPSNGTARDRWPVGR